jgi:PHD/YefM family antitoxin component YafN of YafNO toxin-antitoxin module
MHIVSYSEASEDLTALMDTVSADRAPILIHCEDGQNVVMMPASVWADAEALLSITAA